MANDDGTIRSFSALLNGLEDGNLVIDLTNKLAELNAKLAEEALNAGESRGELMLKLKCSCDNGGTVSIECEVKLTEPKPKRQRSVLWLDAHHKLVARNPRQQLLPLREVAPPKPPIDIPNEDAEDASNV
jgi:hypothetical protein